MSNIVSTATKVVTTAEQDVEAVIDKVVDHFKTLIGFVGTTSTRVSTVESDLGDLATKVETDVLGKLDGFEETIRDAIIQPIMDKIASVEADLGAQIAALTGSAPAPSGGTSTSPATVTNPTATTTVTVNPVSATSPATDPASGVSTDPGTTTHVDTSTGVTTTVPHDGSDPTAVSATGTTVAPDPSVVAAATDATQAAGVTVTAAAPTVDPAMPGGLPSSV